MINQLMITPLNAVAKGADTILDNDPYGVTVALISISVVLLALIVLGAIIWGFSRVIIAISKETALSKIGKSSQKAQAQAPLKPGEASGEILAAIAVAIKLNKEALHDHESRVITLNTVARAYSPWSSKDHAMTKIPQR